MGYLDHSKYVSIAMEFRCNLRCVHCMIEGAMDSLSPQTFEKFRELLDYNAMHRRWEGLILTGSEITLHPELPKMAAMARDSGFVHVHIQTHGMHLADERYCRKLVEAGIDQFFISIAGPNAETHDPITSISGSFEKTLAGLKNLEKYDQVISITNTVVTGRNYRLLPAIVERLSDLKRLVQMEFWNYWAMGEEDEKGLLASHGEILPYLKEAIGKAKVLGRQVEIKNYPQCLLGDDGGLLVNTQPQLFIDPAFWPEFMRNGFYRCLHRNKCVSKECLGISSAYTAKFGWEEDTLHPIEFPVS